MLIKVNHIPPYRVDLLQDDDKFTVRITLANPEYFVSVGLCLAQRDEAETYFELLNLENLQERFSEFLKKAASEHDVKLLGE